MPRRILLADDHRVLRDSLASAFTAAGEEVVGQAADGAEAVALAKELEPDVIVMDLTMPVLDGAAATEQIVAACPGTRVIILTMHDDVARTRMALASGAVGFLSKSSSFAEVHRTVVAASEGLTSLSPEIANSMLAVSGSAGFGMDEPLLSGRQTEILQLIADGSTTKQVARELGIAQKTVHNHLNAIYRRLDTQNLTHAVLSAVRLGIIDLG